jgi:hypothetical protein
MKNRTNEEITKVAYELYERSGRRGGNDLLNWLSAEKIVHFQQLISRGTDGEAIALLEYKPAYLAESAKPTPGKSKSGSGRVSSKGYPKETMAGL